MLAMSGGGMGGRDERQGDIMDSDFWNSHRSETEESLEKVNDDGSPEILEPAHKDNPVNPQTGLPYPDKLMKRFEALRKRFPGNKVIPSRQSPEEKAAAKEEIRLNFERRKKVQQGLASEDEINAHYNHEVAGVKDRLEILEYIMERQQGAMNPRIKEQYEQILAKNKKQLENLENRRQNSLDKLLE